MKRLTKTFKNGERHTLKNDVAPFYVKLSKYEDIEEYFGIDLLKLFTAKTVYYMDWDYVNGKWRNKEGDLTIREADQERYGFSLNINAKSLELCDLIFGELSTYLDFSDYGKNDKYGGWAFTKEELE